MVSRNMENDWRLSIFPELKFPACSTNLSSKVLVGKHSKQKNMGSFYAKKFWTLPSPDSVSAFESLGNGRMRFEHLEDLERMNVRVFVVQADDEANCNTSFFANSVQLYIKLGSPHSAQLSIFWWNINSVAPRWGTYLRTYHREIKERGERARYLSRFEPIASGTPPLCYNRSPNWKKVQKKAQGLNSDHQVSRRFRQ